MSFNDNNEPDIFEEIGEFFDEKIEEEGGFIAHAEKPSTDVVGAKPLNEVNPLREKFFARLIELGYNLDELKDFLDCKTNMLVLSCAGAGKTTGLIFKIIYDLLDGNTMKIIDVPDGYGGTNQVVVPCNILVSTFLKTGAEELEAEFKSWCQKLNIVGLNFDCIKFRTLHAEVYDAIRCMGYGLNISLETNTLLKESMRSLNIRSVMSHSQSITLDEVNDVAGICTYARNRLDDKRYEHSLMSDYNLTRFELDLLLNDYKLRRQSAGVVDFEDLQEILYDGLINNENVRQFIASRYDCIYIDEFQDTSQLQYEIIKYYSVGCRKVTAIGDDDQCLAEDTMVTVLCEKTGKWSDVKIKHVSQGSRILCSNGHGGSAFYMVDYISSNSVEGKDLVVIRTKSGKIIKGTSNHVGFAYKPNTIHDNMDNVIELTMFNKNIVNTGKGGYNVKKARHGTPLAKRVDRSKLYVKTTDPNISIKDILNNSGKSTVQTSSDSNEFTYETSCINELKYLSSMLNHAFKDKGVTPIILNNAILTVDEDIKFDFTELGDIRVGDFVPSLIDGVTVPDEVIDITIEKYTGKVYDLSVKDTRNFIADGITVHNCIYSWRGSDIDIISHIFERDFQPAIRKLTVNYRCAENILNAVVPSIVKNVKRHEKGIKAYNKGGELKIVKDSNVNYLLESIKDDLTKFNTLSVIARTNADLLIPAILLELDGNVQFSVSKSVNIDGRLPRQVLDLMDLILKRHTEKFEGMFKMFLGKYDQYQASKLDNILRVNKQYNLFNIPLKDIEYSVPKLAPIIIGLRRAVEKDQVFGYIYLLELLKNQVYTGQSVYAQKARLFTDFIKKLIVEHKDLKNLSLYELDILFNDVLKEKLNKRVRLGRNAKIKLTTVHEAKGKEWDSVYVWNNIDGCFPNSVGNRDLTPDEFEEERRVHYIAWTRARKKLTVFTSSDRMGIFLKECDLSNEGVVEEQKSEIELNTTIVHKKSVELPKDLQERKADELTTEQIVRNYIVKPKDDMQELSNMEIVLTSYSVDDLVDMLEKDTKLSEYPSEFWDEKIIELLDELADLIYETQGGDSGH